jgi:predicted GNAT family acetyltransferase
MSYGFFLKKDETRRQKYILSHSKGESECSLHYAVVKQQPSQFSFSKKRVRFIEITKLTIPQSKRKQGIGTQLVEKLLKKHNGQTIKVLTGGETGQCKVGSFILRAIKKYRMKKDKQARTLVRKYIKQYSDDDDDNWAVDVAINAVIQTNTKNLAEEHYQNYIVYPGLNIDENRLKNQFSSTIITSAKGGEKTIFMPSAPPSHKLSHMDSYCHY